MSDTDDQTAEFFSIGEASERTDLPESTIRYYDREFSEYLSIERGNNNERLFDEDSLKELEYIRYLIKREDLSVDEVKERLEKEEQYMKRNEMDEAKDVSDQHNEQLSADSTPADAPIDQDESTGAASEVDGEDSFASYEQEDESDDAITQETLLKSLRKLEERMETVEANQEKILELLDMNLQRYNKLVEDL